MSKKNKVTQMPQQQQQGQTVSALDLAEMVADAYTSGGARECRKAAQNAFQTLINAMTKQSQELLDVKAELEKVKIELNEVTNESSTENTEGEGT